MERPSRFEHNRYLGDKRTQVVYDLDEDIESLGRILELVNILVAPLVLVALVAVSARRLARSGV